MQRTTVHKVQRSKKSKKRSVADCNQNVTQKVSVIVNTPQKKSIIINSFKELPVCIVNANT